MIKNICRKIRNNKGEFYIDSVIILIFFLLIIIVFINFYNAMVIKNNLTTFADEIARVVTIYGDTNAVEVKERERSLSKSLGISPKLEFEPKGKINLNETFTVVASYPYSVKIGSFFKYNTTLTSKSSGISEVYYK